MSGAMLRIKTADGTEYEVPEENGEQAMKLLDAKGVKFEASGQRPGQQPGFEPDPNIDPYSDKPDWQRGLLRARDEDMASNDNVAPLERMSQALTGVGAGSAAPAETWLGQLAKNAAMGGGQSGLAAARDTRDWGDTGRAAASGALASGALTGIAGGVGAAAGAAERGLGSAADSARAKAYGLSPDELAAQASERGMTVPDATAALVREGERLAPPNRVWPMDAGAISSKFSGAARGLNSNIEGAIGQAEQGGAQLPEDPRGTVVQGLDHAADEAMFSGRADGQKLAHALQSEAQAADMGPQYGGPMDVRAQKIALDQSAFSGAPGTPESYAGQAAKTHADQYRGMLDNYVQQGNPEGYPGYQQSLSDYGTAATLRDSSGALAAKQQASGGFLPKAIGLAAGGAAGYLAGGLPGAGMGAAAGFAARNAPAAYGPDLAANMARGASGLSGAVATGANWIAQQAPTAAAVAVDLQTPKPTNGALQDQAQDHYTGSQSAADGGRGYLAPQRIKQALQSAPQVLGPYADQLSQAKDDSELEAMIEKLGRTDPRFANQILPRFQQ